MERGEPGDVEPVEAKLGRVGNCHAVTLELILQTELRDIERRIAISSRNN